MSPSALQAVFIDWHLTLSKSIFWEHLATAEPARYGRLRQSLFVTLRERHTAWMRGAWTTEQMMACVSAETGLSYDFVFDEFVTSCQTMTFIAPEAPGLLAALRRRGVRLAIATDNMDCFTRFTVPALRLPALFDHVLNSFDLKALKEDFDASGRSLFFQDYLLARGLAPQQCLLIDDSRPTPEIAARIGFEYRLITAEQTLAHHLHGLLQET